MSEDGDIKLVKGYKRGHMGEPRQVRRGWSVFHWEHWVRAVGVVVGFEGLRYSRCLTFLYLGMGSCFNSDEQDVADGSMQERSGEEEKAENNNHAK